MSHVDTSQLSGYNSLSDKHLAGYFANDRMRGHLRKSGLITRRGQIVSETSYRLNIARKEHKKHVKDLLAQAIVHKTLDLERHRQVAIRQKLEEIAKIELVHRVRENRNRHVVVEALLPLITASPREKDSIPKRRTRSRSGGKRGRSDSPRSRGHQTPSPQSGLYAESDLLIEERTQRVRRSDEDILPFLSPRSSRPQSGPSPRPHRHRSAKYRPISAPSNMPDTNSSVYESVDEDGDVTYVDDDGNTIDISDCEQGVVRSGRSRTPRNREEVDTRHLYSLNPLALRRYANALAKAEQVNTLASPYLIPQIPIPPSSPRTGTARHRSAGNRGRSTSSDKSPKRSPGVDLHRREPPMRHQGDIHSNCVMTMKFHGWALKLVRERTDNRHNVTVEQQHCGGNTLTVYKGLIEPGSTFSFTSKRHRGFPFSLTLYVDGRQDARVSTCCEFGHSKKVRLGAKQGHFSFVGIKGMNPCYKCQVQKGLVGAKAPPKKVKMPPSNPGEEVIVVKTMEVPPKETENAKQSDEEESAHDQILIPVEVDGDEAPNNNADAYESDFEDEDDSPSGRSQQPDEDGDSKVRPGRPVDENDHPKPLPGGGAVTARTDVVIEGQEADQSDLSHTDNHKGESQQPVTNFSFRNADQREITAVEDNGQEESDESESDSSDSEGLVNKMRNKYKKSSGKESSGRDSSSSSSSSSDEEYEAKSSSSSKSSHTSHKVVSSQKEVDDAAADTADDVSDIETDVEWPRRSEDEVNDGPKQKVNDALPPKPQKPSKKIQGILSPKKQKTSGPKKRASFKVDDDEDDRSDVNVVAHRDKGDDGSGKKKRNSSISKEKNNEIGIVAYEDGVEQGKEPLGLRASDAADRKKDDDQTSDIPEISVNKSGVTLFSDRVDDVEPCREHVTVGYEEEMDERGTESDVEGESAEGVGRDLGTSESETSEDMVAQYAARLNELDERAGTEDQELSYKKNLNHGQRSSEDTENGSREEELLDLNESKPKAGKGQEVVPPADLPKILIDSTEAHMAASGQISQERRLSGAEKEPRNMQTTSDEQYNNVEVTLADINSKIPGGVTRRVSAGGESLLSVPCSGIEDKDRDAWTGGSHANQEAEVISPRECDAEMKPSIESSRDEDMQQQIPIILVEGGCQPSHDKVQDEERTRTQSPRRDSIDGSPGRTLSPDRIADTGQYKVPPSEVRQYRTPPVLIRHDRITSSDTESERNSSAEAAAGSVPDRTFTSEDTGLYTEDRPSVALLREESQSVPTIITEHVD